MCLWVLSLFFTYPFQTQQISQELLRKYIVYAKQKCTPKLHHVQEEKITNLYAELRRESMVGGGLPISVRHMESVIRMSEAHAKMHLQEYVRDEDVNVAIRILLESFISTQKFQVMRSLRKVCAYVYLSFFCVCVYLFDLGQLTFMQRLEKVLQVGMIDPYTVLQLSVSRVCVFLYALASFFFFQIHSIDPPDLSFFFMSI